MTEILGGIALATAGGLIIYGLGCQFCNWWDERHWQCDMARAEQLLEAAEEERQLVRWAQALGGYADTALEIERLPTVEPCRKLNL